MLENLLTGSRDICLNFRGNLKGARICAQQFLSNQTPIMKGTKKQEDSISLSYRIYNLKMYESREIKKNMSPLEVLSVNTLSARMSSDTMANKKEESHAAERKKEKKKQQQQTTNKCDHFMKSS